MATDSRPACLPACVNDVSKQPRYTLLYYTISYRVCVCVCLLEGSMPCLYIYQCDAALLVLGIITDECAQQEESKESKRMMAIID